jgi:hypothetical protein
MDGQDVEKRSSKSENRDLHCAGETPRWKNPEAGQPPATALLSLLPPLGQAGRPATAGRRAIDET